MLKTAESPCIGETDSNIICTFKNLKLFFMVDNSVQPLSTDNRSAEPSNGNSDDIIAVQCQIQIDDKNNLHVTYQKRKT